MQVKVKYDKKVRRRCAVYRDSDGKTRRLYEGQFVLLELGNGDLVFGYLQHITVDVGPVSGYFLVTSRDSNMEILFKDVGCVKKRFRMFEYQRFGVTVYDGGCVNVAAEGHHFDLDETARGAEVEFISTNCFVVKYGGDYHIVYYDDVKMLENVDARMMVGEVVRIAEPVEELEAIVDGDVTDIVEL